MSRLLAEPCAVASISITQGSWIILARRCGTVVCHMYEEDIFLTCIGELGDISGPPTS